MATQPALIVEDHVELATMFAEILTMSNIESEIIRDGREALARLREITPLFVLLDIHLPGISGLEILRYIRADPCLNQVKVFVVTADVGLQDQLQDQADMVIFKPVNIAQIQRILSFLSGDSVVR